MSQHDDAFKVHKRAQAHKLSTPHMRALRKELLIARADVERMELAQATADLRHSVTRFAFLKFLMPGGSTRRWGRRSASGGILSALISGGNLSAMIRQYPIVGSILSLLVTKPVRRTLMRSAKPVLKWGGLGLLVWEGVRVYKQMKAASAEPPAETADPTVF
jgi:hypothetical protein